MRNTFIVFALALLLIAPFSAALDVSATTGSSIGASLGDSVSVNSDTKANVNAGAENKGQMQGNAGVQARLDNEERLRNKALIKSELKNRIQANQEGFGQMDIDGVIAEIDSETNANLKAVSFTHVYHGQGWATSSNNGEFVRVMWAEKTFVNSSDEESVRIKGVVKFSSSSAHKLTLVSKTDDSITFDVNAKGESAGTLVLDEKAEVANFVVWSGELKLESGETYTVQLATMKSSVRSNGSGQLEIDADADGTVDVTKNANAKGNLGFWTRVRGWFGSK